MSDDHRPILEPDEIVGYSLRKATRGYKVGQVDELLDQLAEQTAALLDDRDELTERVRALEEDLRAASETETTLKRTLVTAQEAAERSVAEAQDEADGIRDQAHDHADEILEQAAEEADELRQDALRAARVEEVELRRQLQAIRDHITLLRDVAAEHRRRLDTHLHRQLERVGTLELPEVPELDEEPDELLEDELLDPGPASEERPDKGPDDDVAEEGDAADGAAAGEDADDEGGADEDAVDEDDAVRGSMHGG